MLTRTGRAAVLAALALALCAVAGCGDGAEAMPTIPDPPATRPLPVTVQVFFADDDGRLRLEDRRVPAGGLRAALDALADGPSDPALIPALPAGTRVLSASSDGDLATVDLSAEFESGYPPGGAAAENAVTGALVRTAAAASGASRVLVRVEGRTPAPAGSQFDFSEPIAVGDLPAP